MASFLKNTGDIILDAVLTDEGRRRLAMGDGSFKITKFALGDDEINYSLWDKLANSGQEDLAIMRTPIFEAYTNNASSMKNKLMTMAANNILFMPILKWNTLVATTGAVRPYTGYDSVIIPVYLSSETNPLSANDVVAYTLTSDHTDRKISIHQGIDSSNGSDKQRSMVQEGFGQLVENEYNVMVDSRLLYIPEAANGPLSIDDDYMATYSFSLNDGVVSILDPEVASQNSPILGSRGTKVEFRTLPQMNLANSGGLLFSKLGSVIPNFYGSDTYQVIRSVVKVVGVTTGYSIEIPVILAKKQ